MKKFAAMALMLIGGLLMASETNAQACSDLFFSEYTEGATGTNKAIEIYNPTSSAISLSNYSVKLFANGTATATATLPLTGSIASHGTLVIANSASVAGILAATNIQVGSANAATNVANFNGDDAVSLVKTVGTNEVIVDIIGNIGCDPGTDWNNGTSTLSTMNRTLRRKATVTMGVTSVPAGTSGSNTTCPFPTLATEWDDFIDTDYTGLGSHTSNCVTPPAGTTIGFASAAGSVVENVAGGTTTVSVNITNPSATVASSVSVSLATTGTATPGTDFTFTNTTLNWAAGDNTPKTVTVTIIDDAIFEPSETIILNLTNPSTGVTLGTATFTLTIIDNEIKPIPTYSVAQVTTNNPTTVLPDSMGVKVKLVGVLHGINQRTTGLQITLIDNTGGIGLFTSSATVVPTPAPEEGDLVRAIGTIGHFNGLTQLTLDSIKVITKAQPLVARTIVTGALGEQHESEYITIANPVTIVDPNQWTNTGSGFTVQVTDGVNTYDMRIVSASNIFGTTVPTGQFVLSGIGGQFDSSAPHDSGYQIIPQRLTDLRNVTGLTESHLANAVSVYPNPVRNILNLNLTGAAKGASVTLVNALGQEVATVPSGATYVNVANLPAGVYMVKVSAANMVAVKRFVKIN